MADKTAHLLIVDDEENIRSALRRVLRREYKLSFAESGPQALELLKTERPDVIISDHLMPEMTGLEFLKRCRLRYPNIGRIVLTGQAEMQMVIAAINEGAVFRFLTKPWDEDELKLTIYLAVEHVKSQREASIEESKSTLSSSSSPQESHDSLVQELETQHPGLTQLTRNQDGAILIDDPLDQEK
jgi:DNA-binding NtrC family response regulator